MVYLGVVVFLGFAFLYILGFCMSTREDRVKDNEQPIISDDFFEDVL